ncbi:MAG: UbiH/UbiF/VisC/COQ6 family ubiquinone biosynthesis hydroxylase [Proteobacteria bacterium]|nr:UbiH/UbiF/VisC/COQ6 family ubiquinone biosynthesis hydroxylase [Pseudomonadota bacterium]
MTDASSQPKAAQDAVSDSVRGYDVVIVGGGIVGLSLACELAGSEFSVAVVERNELKAISENQPDVRVSAINRFALSRPALAEAWQSELAQRTCMYDRMFVWDLTGAGQIAFDSAELGISNLGAIVENNVLQKMLLDVVLKADNINYLCPQEITSIEYRSTAEHSIITLATGEKLSAELLVGADGLRSRVREIADIPHSRKDYKQQGLVCNVTTSESHQNTAWQCFMPSGPLAFLPLYDGSSSIVWSLDDVTDAATEGASSAAEKMALDDEAFKQALAEASEFKLGEILTLSQRYLFPLTHGHASDYIKPGLALIGDAAHNIHPLAGQGANLGIADAATLADIIIAAKKAGRQWSSQHTLAKYQRQRKGANQLMEASMTGFKELFGNNNAMVSEIRNAGLSLVDNLPALKYRVIRQALGV